jgi:hypothetical protein
MNFTTKQVNRFLAQAQKAWGLTDWTIEWQWGNCSYEGDVELRFTEKYALITLDKKNIPDKVILKRTIFHEVGHCIFEAIERGVSDFADHYIKDKKARDVFYEQLNTRQNEILDHIVTKVMEV